MFTSVSCPISVSPIIKRDDERLKSVVLAPQQEISGEEQYPDVYEKTAVYMRNIISDHAFADGNKRSGITVAGVFLIRNGIHQTATPKELEDFAVEVAVEIWMRPWLRGFALIASQPEVLC